MSSPNRIQLNEVDNERGNWIRNAHEKSFRIKIGQLLPMSNRDHSWNRIYSLYIPHDFP